MPEVARRLGTRSFTRGLHFNRAHVTEFIEKPLDYLTDVLSSLDSDSKAAIGLLFMSGGTIAHPLSLSPREKNALELLGSSEQSIRRVLPTLDGDILRLVLSEPSRWTYKHPTIGDAYVRLLVNNPELVDIYLGGVSPDKLMREITCGDVGLVGAIVIPHSRYEQILAALDDTSSTDALLMFLAYRCDKAFIKQFIARHSGFIESLLLFGSFMGTVREVSVLTRLHELSLLPEDARKRFVQRARKLAVDTPDSDFIGVARIRAMFLDEELMSILALVKETLVPLIDSTIDDWRTNYNKTYDPDSYYEPLKDAFKTYQHHFASDKETEVAFESALCRIDEEIDELTCERENLYDADDEYRSSSSSSIGDPDRSIYDDVDT